MQGSARQFFCPMWSLLELLSGYLGLEGLISFMCRVPGWVNRKHWTQLGPFPSPHSLCDSPCSLSSRIVRLLSWRLRAPRESFPREEVETASFLKPGPGHPHSVTSITFYWSKHPQTSLSLRERGINPKSDGKSSQNLKPTCLPHCKARQAGSEQKVLLVLTTCDGYDDN